MRRLRAHSVHTEMCLMESTTPWRDQCGITAYGPATDRRLAIRWADYDRMGSVYLHRHARTLGFRLRKHMNLGYVDIYAVFPVAIHKLV